MRCVSYLYSKLYIPIRFCNGARRDTAFEGVAVGWLAAWSGRERVAVAAAVVALAWPARGPIGLRALAREPWWALVGLVIGVAVGERAVSVES